jgi:P-type E1-E2 ATPase
VRSGGIIPADVKLLAGALTVDQSALAGESKDADKVLGGVLSSGSVVRRGVGTVVVMLTGARTYFGRTTELVQQARPKLHIAAVMTKVVRWLFVIVGALLGGVVILSLSRGAPLSEMVRLMLVLLLSAVPVALPVMFTISMAIGSKELAKHGVLVTRLSAAEDAGPGHVGRGADRDADFGLAERGRIVDPVARHARHMPGALLRASS